MKFIPQKNKMIKMKHSSLCTAYMSGAFFFLWKTNQDSLSKSLLSQLNFNLSTHLQCEATFSAELVNKTGVWYALLLLKR